MNYNIVAMRTLLALLLLLAAAPSRAADPVAADSSTVRLADYFVQTPINEADPKLVSPFLALDAQTLPKRLREKARAKQLAIQALLKLHDTKKKGNWLQPVGGCTAESFVKPLKDIPAYAMAGYVPITEEELKYIMHKTNCTELDLGCQFTFTIFYDKKKPRKLMLHQNDPIDALAAESHGPHGQTNFFGVGLTCQH